MTVILAACRASIVCDIEVHNIMVCDIVVAVRDVPVHDVEVRDVEVRDVEVRDAEVRDVVSFCTIHPWFFTYIYHLQKICIIQRKPVKFTADYHTDSESFTRVGQ